MIWVETFINFPKALRNENEDDARYPKLNINTDGCKKLKTTSGNCEYKYGCEDGKKTKNLKRSKTSNKSKKSKNSKNFKNSKVSGVSRNSRRLKNTKKTKKSKNSKRNFNNSKNSKQSKKHKNSKNVKDSKKSNNAKNKKNSKKPNLLKNLNNTDDDRFVGANVFPVDFGSEDRNVIPQHPWACSLRTRGFRGRHRCGVTLLSGPTYDSPDDPYVLVGAAHCNHICKDRLSGDVLETCCCRPPDVPGSCKKVTRKNSAVSTKSFVL